MDYESMTLKELREIAKEKGIEKTTSMRKAELLSVLKKSEEAVKKEPGTAVKAEPKKAAKSEPKTAGRMEPAKRAVSHSSDDNREKQTGEKREKRVPDHRNRYTAEHQHEGGGEERQRSYDPRSNGKARYHDGSDGVISVMKERQIAEIPPTELRELDSGITKEGILEVMPEGYGFIRCDNYLPGENDVYVAPQFIRRFGLRTGDVIKGNLRMRTQNEKFSALLYMTSVNDRPPGYLYDRKKFETLTPIFPDDRIHLEIPGSYASLRMLDLISPIGKGQRGMIVSPPKAGKTTLLKEVAKSILKNSPDMHLICSVVPPI